MAHTWLRWMGAIVPVFVAVFLVVLMAGVGGFNITLSHIDRALLDLSIASELALESSCSLDADLYT